MWLPFVITMLPSKAHADIEVITNYYSIYGNSANALYQEIRTKGPQGFTGYTDSEINYHYTTFAGGSNCRVAALTIDLVITYTLPRWENQSAANAELQQSWSTTFPRLLKHEQQHGAFAREAYNRIRREVSQIGFRGSCAEVGREVDSIAAAALAEKAENNRNYDSTTDHGRTEGVQFIAPSNTVVQSDQESGASNLFWYFIGALSLGLFYIARR